MLNEHQSKYTIDINHCAVILSLLRAITEFLIDDFIVNCSLHLIWFSKIAKILWITYPNGDHVYLFVKQAN